MNLDRRQLMTYAERDARPRERKTVVEFLLGGGL